VATYHIQRPQRHRATWCGAGLGPFNWYYTGLDHLLARRENGDEHEPCADCLSKALAALGPEKETAETGEGASNG
jgi:hypothetical protein